MIEHNTMHLTQHLKEVKTRLLKIITVFFISFAICYFFKEQLFEILTEPLANMIGLIATRAMYDHGQLAMVAPIPANQAKMFWKMVDAPAVMILKTPTGVASFDAADIKDALIKALECKAVTFDLE